MDTVNQSFVNMIWYLADKVASHISYSQTGKYEIIKDDILHFIYQKLIMFVVKIDKDFK